MKVAGVCETHGFYKGQVCNICFRGTERWDHTGDKMWDFTTEHLEPGTRITSRNHWKSLLRRTNRNDDLTGKELLSLAHKPYSEINKLKRERTMKKLRPVIHRAVRDQYRRYEVRG